MIRFVADWRRRILRPKRLARPKRSGWARWPRSFRTMPLPVRRRARIMSVGARMIQKMHCSGCVEAGYRMFRTEARQRMHRQYRRKHRRW